MISFCLGGGFALLVASEGFDVASVNYGEVPEDAAEVLVGACPIVTSYGAGTAAASRTCLGSRPHWPSGNSV